MRNYRTFSINELSYGKYNSEEYKPYRWNEDYKPDCPVIPHTHFVACLEVASTLALKQNVIILIILPGQ